jgi:hypothetical protein
MQIVFTADPRFIGKAIRFFTRISWRKSGRVSHVALRYGGPESRWMVESAEHGFAPNFWHLFKTKRKIYKVFEIQVDEKVINDSIEDMIETMIGRGYDYGNLVGFALVILWYKITGKKVKNFLGASNLFGCSEAVYRIFKVVEQKTGIKFFGDYDPELVFPEDELIDCESNPSLYLEVPSI